VRVLVDGVARARDRPKSTHIKAVKEKDLMEEMALTVE